MKVGLFKSLSIVTLASLMLSSCGSIINGSTQEITIKTQPNNASIKIFDSSKNPVYSGSSPTTLEVDRSEGFFKGATYLVQISEKGYETKELTIKSSASGWYLAGNLLLGGLIGWLIIDPATGGMWTLSPEDINAELAKDVSVLGDNDGLMIVLREQLPDSKFEELNLRPID